MSSFEDLTMQNGMTVREWRKLREKPEILQKGELEKQKNILKEYIQARIDTLRADRDIDSTAHKLVGISAALQELKNLQVIINGL